ncbi:proton-conducting transporter membrane subunit [Mycolicibacterium poriferae]|uniref:proton-conducting transporter transmembrane domain-containing protein n=1 Tax=Mycolicibacterium poriferae TaxID=39694 RepID=UPI00321A78DF
MAGTLGERWRTWLGTTATPPAFAGLAAITLVFGNLAALIQKSIKRMLAYSSIAHAGYLLLAAYDNTGASDDFIGDVDMDATFNATGATLDGQVTNFQDNADEQPVAGTLRLNNGVLDRTASLTNPDNPGTQHSFFVNADGTLTNQAGDTFAFDSVIYGDVVGTDGSLLTGQVSGDAVINGVTESAGGTFAARAE